MRDSDDGRKGDGDAGRRGMGGAEVHRVLARVRAQAVRLGLRQRGAATHAARRRALAVVIIAEFREEERTAVRRGDGDRLALEQRPELLVHECLHDPGDVRGALPGFADLLEVLQDTRLLIHGVA